MDSDRLERPTLHVSGLSLDMHLEDDQDQKRSEEPAAGL
jgi:hypothetical protein